MAQAQQAERIETLVVGAGQAGLATSYWLTENSPPQAAGL